VSDLDYAPSKDIDYATYLKSSQWREIRRQALAWAFHRCERCGSKPTDLEVHHLTYERLGDEHLHDLEVLCPPCHLAADAEREAKREREFYNRRLEGWASKRWGSDWVYDIGWEEASEEFRVWLRETDS
jgi:5-methylcytosine-specific restriction endonuclease McrA